MVMTSFNTIDGIPATGNKWLMWDILRKEMGFDGVLISDWAAIEETINHGYCANRKEAAVSAAEAGVDIDMMTGIYSKHLCDLVQEGTIPEQLIDESVYRILELKNKLGLFENPYKDADEAKEKEIILCREHQDLSREAARKSFVLLKNDEILPLKKGRKTAFIGPYVDNRKLMGAWSITGDPKDVATLKEAISEWDGDLAEATFCQGSPMLGTDIIVEGFTEKMEEAVSEKECERMLSEAVRKAKEAETVVMAIGEHYLQSGEAASSASIQIPKIQLELFNRVCEVNERVVVVLFSGRPLDIREISQKAKAVLMVWMPGTEGARAIVDVLSGAYAPSGKLPMSMPYCAGQVPIHYNAYSTGRPCKKGDIKDRFRSRYLDIPNEPLYPFGYGLSYTKFTISRVELDKEFMTKEDSICAAVVVKNIGDVSGTETVQMYIHDLVASIVRPVKELKGFCKITLQPGEERRVCFRITERELQFLTVHDRWESEPGEFEVFIGADSSTENSACFRLG